MLLIRRILTQDDDTKYRSIVAKTRSHEAILRDVNNTIIRHLQKIGTVCVLSGSIFQLFNIRDGMPDIREIIFDILAIKKYRTHGFVRSVR